MAWVIRSSEPVRFDGEEGYAVTNGRGVDAAIAVSAVFWLAVYQANSQPADGRKEEPMPTNQIEGLRWEPRWISAMGCLRPCAKHLGRELSWPWLYGGTGYAFILNVHKELCPSGWHVLGVPNAKLCRNLGLQWQSFTPKGHEFPPKKDMPRRQREVWKATRKAIDEGRPCYGYNLEIGDYYVVYGHDNVGYYYSGPMCDKGKGPLPWEKYGTGGDVPGLLCLGAVKLIQPVDDRKTVRDALRSAVDHARSGSKPEDDYQRGLGAYSMWIRALKSKKSSAWGPPYNAACYLECRQHAVSFLKEAKARVSDGDLTPLFDEAIRHYEVVAQKLAETAEAFPTNDAKPEHVADDERIRKATAALTSAREAEAQGVAALDKLLRALDHGAKEGRLR